MTRDSFEKSLKNYDPLLSLRWGNCVNAWVVDRHAPKGISKALWDTLEWAVNRPNCEPIDRERWISAKMGKRPVLHTPVLGKHVFRELYENDIQVHGTKIVDRHMDALDKEKERRVAGDGNTGRIMVEGMDFLARRRATPTPEQQDEVFAEVAGKKSAKRRKKVMDKLGAPPKWMNKNAAQVGA